MINTILNEFVRFSIIIIPILFFYGKIRNQTQEYKLSLTILKWLFISTSIVHLFFWIYEIFIVEYDQLAYSTERYNFYHRAFGEYWYIYLIMLLGNKVLPLFLLIPYFGRSFFWFFIFALFFKLGIYVERWIIMFSSYQMSGLDAYWATNYGIPILLWIVQGIVYATGLLGVSHLLLKLKNSKFYSSKF